MMRLVRGGRKTACRLTEQLQACVQLVCPLRQGDGHCNSARQRLDPLLVLLGLLVGPLLLGLLVGPLLLGLLPSPLPLLVPQHHDLPAYR